MAIFSTATDHGRQLRRLLRGEEGKCLGVDRGKPQKDIFMPQKHLVPPVWDFCRRRHKDFSMSFVVVVVVAGAGGGSFNFHANPTRDVWLATVADLAAVNWAFFLEPQFKQYAVKLREDDEAVRCKFRWKKLKHTNKRKWIDWS